DASGGWGTARQVPGVSIQGDFTVYTAPAFLGVSCPALQDCTVAYMPPGSGSWAPVFSVTQHDGTWGTPRRIPGLRAEPSGPVELACVSVGDCVVAATAPDGTGTEVMVARLAHGTWSQARPVPGLAALGAAGSGTLSALACGRTGWCALAGRYQPPVP